MSNTYDAIVIGGGHNGLVSAAYLARVGSQDTGAGVAGDAGRCGDHRGAVGGRAAPAGHPAVLRDEPDAADHRARTELERHGYKVHPMGPYYQAFPEGGSLTIYEDDPARTHEQLAKFSKKDADAWPKWNAWLEGIADVMGPLLTQVPPNIGSHRPADLLDLAKLAWRQRGIDATHAPRTSPGC